MYIYIPGNAGHGGARACNCLYSCACTTMPLLISDMNDFSTGRCLLWSTIKGAFQPYQLAMLRSLA